MIHTIKCFSVDNEAEVDGFLEFSYFFYDPMDVDNLVSGSSPFSKSSLYICILYLHVLLKPSLKDFEHCLAIITLSAIVWWFEHSLVSLCDWNEN